MPTVNRSARVPGARRRAERYGRGGRLGAGAQARGGAAGSRLAEIQSVMKITRLLSRFAIAGGLIAALIGFHSAGIAADESIRRDVSPTRASLSDIATGKKDRVEFGTSEFKGWLRANGEWYVEGEVPHLGLLCADYEMGLRFGAGAPGCGNVTWLSEEHYATRRKQCNGASVKHTGGATEPELAAIFGKITCVERIVRCSGNCK